MGGELVVHSTPGRGTTFAITLPNAELAHAAHSPARVGRVLIIDDELALLTMFTRMLQGAHDVVTVHDPRVAIERIAAGEEFDVIYCDLMMPHLSGLQVFEQVRALKPQLAERFVFISGGVLSDAQRLQLSELPNEKLEKPISLAVLRDLTASLVDARRRGRRAS